MTSCTLYIRAFTIDLFLIFYTFIWHYSRFQMQHKLLSYNIEFRIIQCFRIIKISHCNILNQDLRKKVAKEL